MDDQYEYLPVKKVSGETYNVPGPESPFWIPAYLQKAILTRAQIALPAVEEAFENIRKQIFTNFTTTYTLRRLMKTELKKIKGAE